MYCWMEFPLRLDEREIDVVEVNGNVVSAKVEICGTIALMPLKENLIV